MFVVRLHRDERGSISIVTVFFALFLVMLLGMVMNVSREVAVVGVMGWRAVPDNDTHQWRGVG